MDKYIILFLSNNTNNDIQNSIKEMLQATTAKTNRPNSLSETKTVQFCQLCLCTPEGGVDGQSETSWVDITEDLTPAVTSTAHTCTDQLIDQERTSALAEDLHKLASGIPQCGAYVDLVWPVDVIKHLEVRDHLILFGALKRLVEWHNTHVHFLTNDKEEAGATDRIQEWLDLLRGSLVLPSCIKEPLNTWLWRGSVIIKGSQATKSLRLPGFCLSNLDIGTSGLKVKLKKDTDESGDHTVTGVKSVNHTQATAKLMSETLELIKIVPINQVPSFYITQHAYMLHVPSSTSHLSSSHEFLQRLKKDKKAAFILRLHYGTSLQNVCNKKNGHERKDAVKPRDWKELVIDNIANVADVKTTAELHGDVGSHLFLIHAGPETLKDGCIAYLMRKPSSIDGSVAADIVKREIMMSSSVVVEKPSEDTVKEMDSLLQLVPHMKASALLDLHGHIGECQYAAVKHWLGKRGKKKETKGHGRVEVSELVCLLRGTSEACRRSVKGHKYFSERPKSRVPLQQLKPEYEQDPATQLERMALSLRQTPAGSGLASFHSNDSLGGLSPPVKGQVLMLDPSEFLRHFKEDGTAARIENDTVTSKDQGCCMSSWSKSDELSLSSWPECLHAKGHGIYYNCGDRAEVEQKLDRLKARLLPLETSSLCTTKHAKSPRTIRLADKASTQEDKPKEPEVNKSENSGQRRKRKAELKDTSCESKRVMATKEKDHKEEDRVEAKGQVNVAPKSKDTDRQSRSERHKRKLETVVVKCLENHGVTKKDVVFPACVRKLYTLTKCFVKDLKTSHNLRQEMERIADGHVQQVIDFEKRMKK